MHRLSPVGTLGSRPRRARRSQLAGSAHPPPPSVRRVPAHAHTTGPASALRTTHTRAEVCRAHPGCRRSCRARRRSARVGAPLRSSSPRLFGRGRAPPARTKSGRRHAHTSIGTSSDRTRRRRAPGERALSTLAHVWTQLHGYRDITCARRASSCRAPTPQLMAATSMTFDVTTVCRMAVPRMVSIPGQVVPPTLSLGGPLR